MPVSFKCGSDFPLNSFAAGFCALIEESFAVCQRKFDFNFAFFKIDLSGNDGESFFLCFALQSNDLPFVHKQFACTEGFMVEEAR